MPGTVNGWTVAYTAAGGLVLWSGIAGTSLSATVKGALAGQTPAQLPQTEAISAPAAQGAATASAAAGGSSGAASPSASSWAKSFLSAIGAPATAANLQSVENWITVEGDFSSAGHNNPLNTTLPTAASTGTFNSAGVQNYGSAAAGLAATVQTLEAGGYGDILMLLRSGQGLASGAAAGLKRWSGGAYGSV